MTDDLRNTLAPVTKDTPADQVEFRHTEQNTDGSTPRQDRVYRYTGMDVTPTFDVSAVSDEEVRVIAHSFPAGVEATLQAVHGRQAGSHFTDVVIDGLPVVVSAQHTALKVPLSGRYRFLFKGGWGAADEARIAITRQQRSIPWDGSGHPVWVYTGREDCRDAVLYRQEQNQHGHLRWVAAGTCYDPTYPLPCGGWAFGPGDIRDPAATVELTDCIEGVGQNLWVYPAPAPGRTFPVYDCAVDFYCLSDEDVYGYAANQTRTGIRNLCYDNGPCANGAAGRRVEGE